MEESKIDRINELAREAKLRRLTPQEEAERAELRREYLAAIRRNLEAQLDNTFVVDQDGNKRKLKKRDD